jgi:DNA-binding Xre family transcriptional regulator
VAGLKDFDNVREAWLKNTEVKEAYDGLAGEFQIAGEIIKARMRARITQGQLADRIGTKPTAISRAESPNYGKLSISTLNKIAQALDCNLEIRLRPKKSSRVK